jgi:NADH dehydrogenase FAD-containing subunit
MMGDGPRILIVGGGYGGLHTALHLERLLRSGEATVMVADPRSYTTYQPLLAEAAAGNLEPRHVVVPLRAAQHAYWQARRLAGNIAAVLRDGTPRPYRHASAGSVASLGLYRGVAEIYGLRMRGFPAWMVHRTYYLLKLPTMNRRLRVVADWTLALLFPREVVSLDVLEHPRQDFEAALRVIATRPSRQTSFPVREEKEDDQHAYRW